MKQYHDLLEYIFQHGKDKNDRTGTGTRSIFGYQLRFDISTYFPLITTKKIHFPSVIHELLWFLKGESNINYLKQNNITIWDEWANENGELGPIYGVQWRNWNSKEGAIDQISSLIDQIKKNPDSRRHIVSAWNVADIDQMALPPCHVMFQFYVSEKNLSCHMYQRSADVFLGLPFNIASYAALTYMVAHVTHLNPDTLVISTGDTHIYHNHFDQVKLQLTRDCRPLPTLELNSNKLHIDEFLYEDFKLKNYNPHPGIKAPIAV